MQPDFGERRVLQALLHDYNEFPERRPTILSRIDEQFRQTLAVLVLDSSGFSRITRAHGIVHFLAIMERLERQVRPIVESNAGRVLRIEADNIFAVFAEPDSAVKCAVEIQRTLAAANEALPRSQEVYASIGIGYGNLLVVGPDDVYGDEMNLACKFGEDLAEHGEVLLTEEAYAHLGANTWEFEIAEYKISGIEVSARRLLLDG